VRPGLFSLEPARPGHATDRSPEKEEVMPVPRKHRLSEAVKPTPRAPAGGKHEVGQAPGTEAEQVREAQESARAREAGASNRDRMVNIGRANQQAGRQK
jgi:hypothetical protein